MRYPPFSLRGLRLMKNDGRFTLSLFCLRISHSEYLDIRFRPGFIEYGISNDTGVTVVVACNVGADRRIMKIQSITVLIFRPVIMKWKGRLNF